MSIEPEDLAMLRVAEHEARKLAAAARSLAELVTAQHYYASEDAAAVLAHVAELLERVASGGNWDGIKCQDAPSIEVLRAGACEIYVRPPETHSGAGAVRRVPMRDGSTRELWACEGCWAVLREGRDP